MGQKYAAGRLLALLSACFICTHARVDPDLWGHLRFGLDAVASGHLSITDPYSFTQDVPWINHEWLSEVTQALAYRSGGVLGMVLLKAAVLAAAFLILANASTGIDERHRWWLLAAGIIGVAPAAFTMRPQIWTLLAIPLLWHALDHARLKPVLSERVLRRAQGERVEGPSRYGWLAVIPALFALWANLHGGWIVGMGVGGLWLVGRAIDRWTISKPTWGPPSGGPEVRLKPDATVFEIALALVAGLAATLLNPYGWGLWRFLLTTVRPSRAISEWRPVWEQDDVSSALIWLGIASVIVVPTIVRRRSSIAWAGALPVAWLGIMSLFVARLVPLFGEVALLGLAGAWRTTNTLILPPSLKLRRTAVARSAEAGRQVQDERGATSRRIVDAVVVAVIAAFNLVSEARCLPIVAGNWSPDLRAASALASPAARGRLVLPFNWGEYAIWHFGPRLRVSIDGRRETVYSDRVVDIQSAAAHGLPQGLEYLRQTQPEYVWLPSDTGAGTGAWLGINGYRIDVETGGSFVATRIDRPPLSMAAPMSLCFP